MKKEGHKESGNDRGFSVGRLNELLSEYNIIYIYGKKCMMMEGCKKVIKCDGEEMILKCAYTVKVHGRDLTLRQLGNNIMGVEGCILNIDFGEE